MAQITSISEVNLSRTEITKVIDEWVFSERDREILKRRFFDNIKFEDLSREFDLSVRQVKNIVYRQGEKVLMKLPT